MKRIGILFGVLTLGACMVCAQDNSSSSSTTGTTNDNATQSQTTTSTTTTTTKNDSGNSTAQDQDQAVTDSRKNAAAQDENAADAHKAAAKDETTKEGAEQQKVLARLDDAAKDIDQLLAAPDKGIPEDVFAKAKCVAIVPSMIKGGFVFGAEHGRGVASCRLPNGGWSAPAFFVVTGGSWGAQIGAEGVDLVMLVMNDNGMNQLLNAKFKLGAAASASAGPVGRQAAADTSWKMNSEILTYSRARGLFAGATLNGASVKEDMDSMRAYYNRSVGFRPVLTGQVKDPNPHSVLQATLRKNHAEVTNAQAH
jgi:SH3 domain-containing YSC84-like protein 1